jgi:hypothetical protein
MDYAQEIEKLRNQIFEKDLKTGERSKTIMIELYIDINRSTFNSEEYYFYILGPLKGLLLVDNYQLHLTNFELFKKFWTLAQKDVTVYYNCWISIITDDEKKELMGCQTLTNISNVSVSDFEPIADCQRKEKPTPLCGTGCNIV